MFLNTYNNVLHDREDNSLKLYLFVATILAHSTCFYDGVKIYKGSSASENLLATLCGNTIPGPFSTFGPMLINFYSDSIINDNGFLAEYMAVREYYMLNYVL